MNQPRPVAYLVSQYPAVSHTFILREVLGLRARGVDVRVASVQDPDRPQEKMTAVEGAEVARTHYLKRRGALAAGAALAEAFLRAPLRVLRALRQAARLAGADPRRLLYHVFYIAEAALLGSWMRAQGIGRVHVHFANAASSVGLLTSSMWGVDFSFSVHGPDEFFDAERSRLREKVARASFVRCIGAFARSQMMFVSDPEHWDKFRVCPLGVDPSDAPARADGGDGRTLRILCVGRLVAAKGQEVLLAALKTLIERGRPAQAVFVGAGPMRARLERKAAEWGLSQSVEFTGALNQDAVRVRYAQADVFVLPSFAEGIPVVLMEAMAAGIPCVSTHVAGIHELIRTGQDGILVSPSDTEGLADVLDRLHSDPGLRRSLGAAGAQRVRERYDLEKNLDRLKGILAVAACALLMAAGAARPARAAAPRPEPSARGVLRFGVNLGRQTPWGAEQLMSNVLANPGFEPTLRRAVGRSAAGGVMAPGRGARWDGAGYEVLEGRSAGRSGRLRLRPDGSLAADPALPAGELLSLEEAERDEPPALWIPETDGGRVRSVAGARPGSPGRRAVELDGSRGRAALKSVMDSLGGERRIELNGRWRLRFWARAAPGGRLGVRVQRAGRAVFDAVLRPGGDWEAFSLAVGPEAGGPAGPLEVVFQAAGGAVTLDDAELAAEGGSGGAFRDAAVQALAALRPGVLRDWQDQLGDSLANRLAEPFARRPYALGGADGGEQWGYSIPEFFTLSRKVGARPWVVAPVVLRGGEWPAFGAALRRLLDETGSPEVVVEFGNENWNDIYAAGSLPDPREHGRAAEAAFAALLRGAQGDARIVTAVNGQYAAPARALGALVPSAQALAAAPYYGHSMEAGETPAAAALRALSEGFAPLETLSQAMRERGKALFVAEVNAHTTSGGASGAERASVVAGAASGTALARALLAGLKAGVRRQCAYVFLMHDYPLGAGLGRVPLWGLVRRLGPQAVYRPTGLALGLLNTAVGGQMHELEGALPPGVSGAAFRDPDGWSAALVSTSSRPEEAVLELPPGPPLAVLVLSARGPLETNEASERVTVSASCAQRSAAGWSVALPPYGMGVLVPEGRVADRLHKPCPPTEARVPMGVPAGRT